MKRVLILGGGFGGIATARRLKQKLDEKDELILVDRRDTFMVGFRKTWALTGQSTLEEGQRPLNSITRLGVRVMHDPVTRIDPAGRAAWMGDQRLSADALVIALGAETTPEAIPGFEEYAYNVYDPQAIPRAAQALNEFQGGNLLIGIFGIPYKCPPAPYEMALLIRESLQARGVRTNVEVFTPQPVSMPLLGQVGCDIIEGRLEGQGITFLPNRKATAIEPGEVVFANERRRFDLLFGIPPHRPPAVVRESGLVGESGWVSVNSRTLETQFPGVYAIGDVVQIAMANGKPLPKAGVFAEAMGETVADRIAAEFAGQDPEVTFQGEGGCYLEVGNGQAMMVTGHFMAVPDPEVSLTEASTEYLEEKRAFEAQRLRAWFE
ncbi:MAG TPA: FAD/NAD(P)-binding oxidoreductase [Anaerolineales bacterium]|jgi:sulfide:quinone oxidoreductase|nr:FAD/NAD(P)-binding oxidoreductase [Anaerolineales bacterium]